MHGNKSASDLGRLRDVLVNEGSDRANLLPDQLWLLKLCDHVQKVEDLMSLCVSFLDTYQSFDVTRLGERPSGISDSTHSNWASPKNPGPREDIGLAMAALYGFGCPDDDPSRPMAERRKLWKACNDPLWRLWCDGEASEFIDAYTRAISENRLWFPASVRGAMHRQPTRRPVDLPHTLSLARSLRQRILHVWSQVFRHDTLKLAGFTSTLVLMTGTGVAFWTDKMTLNNRPVLPCALL